MISVLPFLLDILKLIIAGSAVFFIAYNMLKAEFDKNRQMRILDLRKSAQGTTLPLRLQAHERIVLFIERINPSSLLVRTHAPGLTVVQMQQMLTTEIQNEFQHNVTQQVYLSIQAWVMVRRLKDDTINLINQSAKTLEPEAPSLDLSKLILTHMASLEDNPYDAALALIKADIQEIF
ncbi:hypothetical protein [Desertivirga arenae]|uniref:DUF7935 family protein n=1 Tax=Desertivirga arenae TaxID=2810309 RepID=UPI001A95F526|nr:hypothetical protein [Pedobacter sp. SYSU D00823]